MKYSHTSVHYLSLDNDPSPKSILSKLVFIMDHYYVIQISVCTAFIHALHGPTYVLLTAARAIPSYTRPDGAAVRKCIEYGIALAAVNNTFITCHGQVGPHMHMHTKK